MPHTNMKTTLRFLVPVSAGLALALATGCQQMSQRAAGEPAGNVVVEFQDMDRFTDFGDEPWGNAIRAEDAAALFRQAVENEAQRYLRAGQTFRVTFTDVDLAGDHLPSARMGPNSVRVVKQIYPPRIRLSFTLTDANGAVLKEGERSLTDHAFMERADISLDRALRYDLALLRDWIRSELR